MGELELDSIVICLIETWETADEHHGPVWGADGEELA